MQKSKVMIYYKDGSRTTIRCKSHLARGYVGDYINKSSVKKITRQDYPLKDNLLITHKDVESEDTK